MNVSVETHENALGDREPRRFRVGPQSLEVAEVLDRWLDPEHGYFKVQVMDGTIYILHLDVLSGRWDIALYESGYRPDQPILPEVKSRH